jgi:2-polyprenyl-3-methyl-5-hydroxy-6-metoxy-1,4-benzoquinol methylase
MTGLIDKAGREYWDEAWSGRDLPDPIDPLDRRIDNHVRRRLHRFMSPHLAAAGSGAANRRPELIEVGCAGSRWLPYFAKEFNFLVSGLDYSEVGCNQARAVLEKASVAGEIYHGDIFDPPSALLYRFDVVFSFGLVEHFSPTDRIVRQLAKLARVGGSVITIIPNMTHVVGWLQKLVDRNVYNVHVPLDERQLIDVHETCGLSVTDASYLGSVDWSVVNFSGHAGRWSYPILVRLAAWATKVVWIAEVAGFPEIRNRWTSPYIVCVATLP